ncbi:hypothetical protein B296_00038044 [Ensete ventricosum]|uniref:Uncharacterized protein n=1 Tax=Ensete ventricosum TaxID=4639 RepID=A0A426XI06_ENSVE|nr:hypothetical protein B296_00038044 [Ensete ventricosum]
MVKLVRWLVFTIPLSHKGAIAYIVGVVDHPYLATRLPLWLTLSSYASTTPAVLAVRDASTGRGIGLTYIRSAVRPLGYRPYMCQVDRTTAGDSVLPVPGRSHDHWRPHTCVEPASHVGSATSASQLSEGAMMWRPDKVFDLVLQVTTFLGVVIVFSVKAVIPSCVAPLGVRLHGTWGLQEPLFPYLEEDLCSGRIEGNQGGLAGNKPNVSSLLFGGGAGCPRDYSPRGRFVSSSLPAISISAAIYCCARCSISGRVVGGRSISDQKNLDGLSPVKNAWMARDGWRSGISWTCDVNRPTNWERGSSLPWAIPRREAVVGLGRALVKKFSSNSLASESNEGIDAGLRREYQVMADPLMVVEKA